MQWNGDRMLFSAKIRTRLKGIDYLTKWDILRCVTAQRPHI